MAHENRYRGSSGVIISTTQSTWKLTNTGALPVHRTDASGFSLRLRSVEGVLENSDLSPTILAEAQTKAKAEVAPIDDVRSTEQYRRDLVGVYVRRALEAAIAQGDDRD